VLDQRSSEAIRHGPSSFRAWLDNPFYLKTEFAVALSGAPPILTGGQPASIMVLQLTAPRDSLFYSAGRSRRFALLREMNNDVAF